MAVDKDMSVLVVDDYKTMLRIVTSLLHQIGFYNIDQANNGEAAYDRSRPAPSSDRDHRTAGWDRQRGNRRAGTAR